MKQKKYIVAITALVIAGLLITSATGIQTQKTTVTENSFEKIEKNPTVLTTASLKEFARSREVSNEVSMIRDTSSMAKSVEKRTEKQTAVVPSVQLNPMSIPVSNSPLGERTDYPEIIRALHPGMGHDGGSVLLLGFEYLYQNITFPEEDFGPAVIYQGSNDLGGNWSSGLYYIDPTTEEPLDLTYPSVHYKGIDPGTMENWFSGTVVAPTLYDGDGFLLEVIGDVTVNTSYSLYRWPWSNYGWYDSTMAENAPGHYPGQEWCWGFNTIVASTTYTTPPLIKGHFIQYPYNNSGWNTISWYSGIEGAMSCDNDIDSNSNWVPETGPVYYAGYAVADPFNDTQGQHDLGIREFDWEQTCVWDNAGAFDQYWVWSMNTTYMNIEHPSVDAEDGNLNIVTELRNASHPNQDTMMAFWHTNDGEASNIDIVAIWFVNTTEGGKILSPDIMQIEGNTYMCTMFYNGSMYAAFSFDGGETWDGLYLWSGDDIVIEDYRYSDLADRCSFVIWEYDNSQGLDDIISLHYTLNTVKLDGYCFDAWGVPVDPVDVRVSNTNETNFFRRTPTITGNYYNMVLLLGFDVWTDPEAAPFRIYARDPATHYKGVTDHDFTEINIVNTINITVNKLSGDCYYDANCCVNLQDLAKLLGSYGVSSPSSDYDDSNEAFECDYEWDGDVDLSDLADLLGHYGQCSC